MKQIKNTIDFDRAFIYIPKGHQIKLKGGKKWNVKNGFFVNGNNVSFKEAIKSFKSKKYEEYISLSDEECKKKYPSITLKF